MTDMNNLSDEPLFSSRRNPESQEADFSDSFGGDPEALENSQLNIRSLSLGDLAAIVRIDRHATGRDRSAYLAQKTAEVLEQSGVRISLVAEDKDMAVGFIMARLDYGEFGRTFPMAVIDTIGVDSGYHGVGQALLQQLTGNLRTLRVDGMRTIVRWDDHELIHFLSNNAFAPAQRIALRCPL
ncbi:MAG: hypothetical protein DHS20C01_14720 [marine bacterium B5-7]|nr:MAG: hypothetical protein DHS20C01_14720 [marine bacterium B5-7]